MVPFDPTRSGSPASSSETDYAPSPSCSASVNWKSPTTTAAAATNCAWRYCLRRRFGRDALVGDLRPEGRRADRPFRLS
ncbi:hypothetical protein ACPA9J_04605 [Pseudomonas aeruginosa]